MNWQLRYLSAAALYILAAGPGLADTIFTDFGPGNSYNHGSGDTVGLNFGIDLRPAMQFSAAADYNLTQIDLAVSANNFAGAAPSMTVSLYADGGGILGTLLDSWVLTSLANFSSGGSVQTISGISGIALTSGLYWLEVSVPSGFGVWHGNDQGAVGPRCDPSPTCSRGGLGAFDVIGTPTSVAVPGPIVGAGLPGLALACGGLIALAKRRRKNLAA